MEKHFLDQFVILFIDDILVYSKSKERYDPNYSTHDLNVVVVIFAHKIWRYDMERLVRFIGVLSILFNNEIYILEKECGWSSWKIMIAQS